MDASHAKNDSKIYDKIIQRDTERKREQQTTKDTHARDGDNLDAFHDDFVTRQQAILHALNEFAYETATKTEIQEHLNGVSREIGVLQAHVTNASLMLRKYDVRKFEEHLTAMTSRLNALDEQYLPKKKFAFRNRVKASDVVDHVVDDVKKIIEVTPPIPKPAHAYNVENDEIGFNTRENETLTLTRAQAVDGTDVNLQNLTNCRVTLDCTPSTLHIVGLQKCHVVAAPVSTSIFIENCTQCHFVIACQQLRMHSSRECHVYLHVTSKAIVEDCHKIGVATYEESAKRMLGEGSVEDGFVRAGLNCHVANNWDRLDDFNWLSADKPSPNWFVLSSEEIREDHVRLSESFSQQ